MKILMVSIFSPHFFSWTEQLKASGHEVYWLDVYDSNTEVEKIDFAHQIIGWRYKNKYPGRYFIKKKFPMVNRLINILNERKLDEVFKEKLEEIKPDVVHSFVMYAACSPILNIMEKNKTLRWIFSAWGNDLYYYRKDPAMLAKMKNALQRINYMFADCKRDLEIARELGFKGNFLGAFPGGGGFNFEHYEKAKSQERNIILIKGYQHKFGRCNNVLKALSFLANELKLYRVVVFGAHNEVFEFVQNNDCNRIANLEVKGKIEHSEVLELMGKSLIYIGNSISDGMPNTLLEAIIMGAFPIQSNPGGATAELIVDGKNGLLIQHPESSIEIAETILKAINNIELIKQGMNYNNLYVKPKLEREKIQDLVLEKYKLVEQELNS